MTIVKRKGDPCQLCKPHHGWRAVPPADVTVANYRLCVKHLEILIAILEGR